MTTQVVTDTYPRCAGSLTDGRVCNRVLAEYLSRPWSIRCKRCGSDNRRG